LTRASATHTPVIAQSTQPSVSAPLIPLRARLHQLSTLPGTPVLQISEESDNVSRYS